MKKTEYFIRILFIIAFASVVIIPLLCTNWAGGEYSANEQRNLAGFPVSFNQETKEIEVTRNGIENWISDNIGFRNTFLKLYTNLEFNVFNQSTSDKVMIGRDGWYYYTYDNNIEIATGDYPLTDDDLKLIAENQQRISNYYKSIGVEYILMLTPSKVSVYPEYLPMNDKTVSYTVSDKVADYLRANTDVIVYNAKDALMEAKSNGAGQLYHKTDTHWNERGSYYVYRGLHKVMVENGILNDEAIDVEFSEGTWKGEFSRMLGNDNLLDPEPAPIANWNVTSTEITDGELYYAASEIQNRLNGTFSMSAFENQSRESLCLQIYGDSQLEKIRKIPVYLAEHFSTVVNYGIFSPSIDADNVYNPDVVVLSCSERYINPRLLWQTAIPNIIEDPTLPQTEYPSQQTSYGGMWLDYVNNNLVDNQGEISSSLYMNSEALTLVGWAADFNAYMPLSALYLKIGDRIVQCDYGIERTSVSDYFQNENLKMTGFSVTIPKSLIDSADKLEFIQVGYDGSYRFESVEYKLTK